MVFFTVFLRMLATFVAALLFGLERQRSHKPVSFGTFIFVSMGSCALGIIAISETLQNPASLLAAIVTGIGFLGAGALVRQNDKVYHFTTAAAIWLFAILGLTIGIGEYAIAWLIYSGVWIVILFDHHLESRGIGYFQRHILVTTNKMVDEKVLAGLFIKHAKSHKLLKAELNKESHEMTLDYVVTGRRERLNALLRELYKEEWFKSAKTE
jgi:putative Mg2+ transporter-C (MgtC) family protein